MSISRRTMLAWAAAVPFGAALAQIGDIGEAINKAGRQRMLSQRLAKAYLCIGQQVQMIAATKVLEQSMALFDRQLVELKAYAPNATVRDTYGQLESQWSAYKTLLIGVAPSAANAGKILALDSTVLALANTGTAQLEQVSGRSLGKLVNIAGRQRMLSQRMAKYYMALTWGVEASGAGVEIEKARQEFTQALQVLNNAPEATPEIKRELALADGQWILFNSALGARPSLTGAGHVFVASENLLTVMDKVTELYAKLGRA
ncbi:MAG: type IV pili methyl-accepting chemotaxis transducer N-terminal domain-containing protein [Rhodoferax sp.]